MRTLQMILLVVCFLGCAGSTTTGADATADVLIDAATIETTADVDDSGEAALDASDISLDSPDTTGNWSVTMSGWTIEANAGSLRLSGPNGAVLESFDDATPARAVFAFRRAVASSEMRFGAFKITETPSGDWIPVVSFGPLTSGKDGESFDLLGADGKTLGTALISRPGVAGLESTLHLNVTAMDSTYNRAAVTWKCNPDEHFLGLGGQSFDVDHRGRTVPLWVSEDGIGKQPGEEDNPAWFLSGNRYSTHSPMPIFHSSRNYSALLQTPARAVFHMCSDDAQAVRLENWQGSLSLDLFAGDLKSRIGDLTTLLGRPELPPKFAFFPWLDAINGSANVRRVAQKLRAEKIPVSVIWTEDWRGGTRSFGDYTLDEDWNVDPVLYPDLPQLSADLHAWGYKFLTYNNTFLTQDADVFAEATQTGYAIRNADQTPYIYETAKFVPGSMLDLTNPDAVNWAKAVYKRGIDAGADGWMADFCEWLPTDATLFSGEDPWLVHNRYPVDCQKLNKELLDSIGDGVERLVFVRSAWLGSQPLVSVFWAGDQQTDFQEGDGLPSVIPMGIGTGVTGFPYFGSDIAGYMSALADGPTSKELWFRWLSFGALSPVMRTHHGKSAFDNWNWESDVDSTAHMRRYARLHTQLFPLLWAAAQESSAQTGLPLMQPLAVQYPDFEPGWTMTDQYLLAGTIVVAPVQVDGATSRQVRLPPGTWFPLLGGKALVASEGASLTVEAAITEIPAFVPAGTLLVLLPDDVDTAVELASGTEWKNLANVGADREVWLWPGENNGNGSKVRSDGISGIKYDWNANGWNGQTPGTVTWNDAPVVLTGLSVDVTGPGTLKVDGAILAISGGEVSAVTRTRIRLMGL
jgi:alpha-glucosidase